MDNLFWNIFWILANLVAMSLLFASLLESLRQKRVVGMFLCLALLFMYCLFTASEFTQLIAALRS